MPTWLIALEAGLVILNAMTPAIEALIQQIIASQNGQPTSAQTVLLRRMYLSAVIQAGLPPTS